MTIAVAQAEILTIFNLSQTLNTCLFTNKNKASKCKKNFDLMKHFGQSLPSFLVAVMMQVITGMPSH